MKTLHFAYSIVSFILFALPFSAQTQDIEIAVSTSSKEALDYFLKGREKFENYDINTAEILFELAISVDSNFALAYYYLPLTGSKMQGKKSNLMKAVALANQVSEGEKNMILYAFAAVTHDTQAERNYMNLLLTDYPSDKRIRTEAGNYFYNIKDYENALEQFTIASQLDATYAPAFMAIGYTQSQLNNFDEAEKAFKTLIQLIPKRPDPYDSYAKLLLKMGRYDQSIAQYKKALELDPIYSYPLVGLGDNYVFKGDYITARKYYREYYYRAPTVNDKYDALHWEAVSYIYEGLIDKAMATYDLYENLAERDKDPYHSIIAMASQGQILIESGNEAEGRKKYEKAIKFMEITEFKENNKDNPSTYSGIWNLYALHANNEFKQAVEDQKWSTLRVENKKNLSDELFLNTIYGFLAYRKGESDHAVEHSSKGDPQDPLSAYYSAMAYSKKGDRQKANQFFEFISKSNNNTINLALARNKSIYRQLNNMAYTK